MYPCFSITSNVSSASIFVVIVCLFLFFVYFVGFGLCFWGFCFVPLNTFQMYPCFCWKFIYVFVGDFKGNMSVLGLFK